ncbi:hypothetical protein AGMMS49525_03150 [Bacteroidia bacterium]|nr:hypothetical protein AGMMS49525_03150 [Bacteroidia bacterium]
MKKVCLVLVLAVSAISTTQAQVSWGIKGGANLLFVSAEDNGVKLKQDNVISGYHLGPMIECGLPAIGEGFALDAALLYSHNGYNYDGSDFSQGNILIPVNFKYKFDLSDNLRGYALAGPYFNLNITDNAYKMNPEKDDEVITGGFGGGLNIGVGLELKKHFQAGVSYQLSLTNDLTIDANSAKTKNSGLVVSVAYLF